MNEPSAYQIRPAVHQDLEAILRMDARLFEIDAQFDPTLEMNWTYSEDGLSFFQDRIAGKDGAAFVAEGPEGIAGYLCATTLVTESYRTVRRLAELECMFVTPDARRHGIGSRLVEAFVAWARAAGLSRLHVVASAGNQNAIRFYEKLGFQPLDLTLERDC
ncbi:MAG: GNAT family N-acetyltransferase [Kiritimatiellae bacterium]|nr:GNAT family N-acetyltransferase [Kiritimatiellia bacterium]